MHISTQHIIQIKENMQQSTSSQKEDKTESKSIISEYFHLTHKYQSIYGKNCCVLLMVGSFYEIYSVKNTETNEISTITPIVEISQICNLNIADNRNVFEKNPVVMAGFRDYSLQKYLQKLIEHNYTVVVYDQEKKDKEIIRKCSGVYSPGTYISYETDILQQTSNFIMCIWIEQNKRTNNIIHGVSVVNIFTGESYIFEYQTPYFLNPTCFDELERCVSTYLPSEVLLLSPFNDNDVNAILQYSGIKSNCVHKINTLDASNEKVENCTQQKYLNEVITSFYNNDVFDVCQEFHMYAIATQSFCFLLNFIQEHNQNLVRKILFPSFVNSSNRLILPNHTLKQLNIIDDKTNDGSSCGGLSSVLSFLNKCSTPMGKRLFKYQLTNPTFDEDWLNKEYSITQKMLDDEFYTTTILPIKKQLFQIKDVEKILRQLVSHKIYPNTLYVLFQSVKNIQSIYQDTLHHHHKETSFSLNNPDYIKIKEHLFQYLSCDDAFLKSMESFLFMMEQYFHVELCKNIQSTNTFNTNIIKSNISKELDEVVLKQMEHTKHYNDIHFYLNHLIKGTQDPSITKFSNQDTEFVKNHQTEKSGCSLQITKKRAYVLKTILDKMGSHMQINSELSIPIKDVKFSSASSTNDEIEFPYLTKICKGMLHTQEKMNLIVAKVFNETLETIERNWFDKLEKMAKNVALLDVLCCKTYIAKEYNYCCPVISSQEDTKPFVCATKMRHVLIEHIQQKEIYVPNDVKIGGNYGEDGLLLFGVNAVGKTSYIRSLGISVVMAQSGLFVPCTTFFYKPYHSIFSRILGNDNLFKGLSTFQVEMSELRVILNNANERSLILGDEICHGTENSSALSIFLSTLFDLHKKKSSFIFSTHFNEIAKFEEMQELTNVKIKHMTVLFDRQNDCLVYDRLLKDGMGDTMYGLEICKSLYMPPSFLEFTHTIRNKYFTENKGGVLNNTTTKYNANKIIGLCEICGEKKGTEIHHLQEQKWANNNQYIQSFHKNTTANLINICEKCHKQQHSATTTTSASTTTTTAEIKKTKKIKTTKGFKIV